MASSCLQLPLLHRGGGNEASVQGTNDDAQVSKLSCVRAGYFDDAFVSLFVRRATRRSPLINRGYYARHAALQQLLDHFLQLTQAAAPPAPAAADPAQEQLHQQNSNPLTPPKAGLQGVQTIVGENPACGVQESGLVACTSPGLPLSPTSMHPASTLLAATPATSSTVAPAASCNGAVQCGDSSLMPPPPPPQRSAHAHTLAEPRSSPPPPAMHQPVDQQQQQQQQQHVSRASFTPSHDSAVFDPDLLERQAHQQQHLDQQHTLGQTSTPQADTSLHAPTTPYQGAASSHAPTTPYHGSAFSHAPASLYQGAASSHTPTAPRQGAHTHSPLPLQPVAEQVRVPPPHQHMRSHAQVLVLGAGFDTTWFSLCAEGRAPMRYLEVDFPEVTCRKAAIIASRPELHQQLLAGAGPGVISHAHAVTHLQPLPPSASTPRAVADSHCLHGSGSSHAACAITAEPGSTEQASVAVAAMGGQSVAGSGRVVVDAAAGRICSPRYHLLPVDLRDLTALQAAVETAGLDPTCPTYILAECVLVYMEPGDSAALVHWLGSYFRTAAMAVYEQVRPDDAFGKQMLSNLEFRGCPLLGLMATPTLAAHMRRFTTQGWQRASAQDMNAIYNQHLDAKDRARIERLEIFDEVEEWVLIQEHYCIATAVNDAAGVLQGWGVQGA